MIHGKLKKPKDIEGAGIIVVNEDSEEITHVSDWEEAKKTMTDMAEEEEANVTIYKAVAYAECVPASINVRNA